MSTVSSTRRAPRRHSHDGSTDKVVVNLEANSLVVESGRGASTAVVGTQNSPIDVEAIEDEVQVVSPSRVPPPRRNRRNRREYVVLDFELGVSWQGTKRQRVVPAVHHLPSHRVQLTASLCSILTSLPATLESTKEPTKEVQEEPTFTCPICLNKMEQPSTTPCGHIFCDTCIKQAIKVQKKCPTCRKGLRANSAHRIYLPSTCS